MPLPNLELCACGCGQAVNLGAKWISGHNTSASWELVSEEKRRSRVSGLLAYNEAKKKKKLARLGAQKFCACGCNALLKPGRTWVSGHNAGITPRDYSEETLATFRENIKFARTNLHGGRWAEAMAKPQTEEHKRKNSEGLRRAIAEGRFDPAGNIRKAWANLSLDAKLFSRRSKTLHRRGKFYSAKMNCEFHYESSWELARMEALENSSLVRGWTRIPIRLSYQWKGKKHSYLVDFGVFYNDGRVAYEEVKPANLLNLKNASTDSRDLIKLNRHKIQILEKHCQRVGYKCHVLTSPKECKEVV